MRWENHIRELLDPKEAISVLSYPIGIGLYFEFNNGYGASIVKNETSYGHEEDLWELAVINTQTGGIDYTTSVTEDVEGYLTDEAVEALLYQIRDLDPQ